MPKIELNSDLREAAEAGTPVEVIDSVSGRMYYLISAEQYQKIRVTLSGDFDPREGYPFVDKVMAEDDEADPLLDSYQ